MTGRSRFSYGLPPSELWGVATRETLDRTKTPYRSDAARARRRAKVIAAKRGQSLKAYLRGFK